METRRRAAPAIIVAALLGAGLGLHRPRLVPELRAGSRRAQLPDPALAAAIGWPRVRAPSPAASDEGAELASEELEFEARHDAPSGLGLANASHFSRAPEAPSGGGARFEQSLRRSRSTATTNAPRRLDSSALPASKTSDRLRRNKRLSPAALRAVAAPLKNEPRRALLSSGPAAEANAHADERAAVDPRRGSPNPAPSRAASRIKRPNAFFPLFQPPRRAASDSRAQLRRKARPLLLSTLLGRGALRPPPPSIIPPDFSLLKTRRPLLLPNGAPTPTRPYELDRIEAQDPRRAAGAVCRRRASHWDAGPLWHDGSAHGLVSDARWLWLWKGGTRVWAVPDPDSTPLLHFHGLWWSKQRGVWFALHDGELWSWRRFSAWDAEGLIRLTDGVELVYSADFTKVAVITPGAGAVLYDAATGAELGEWLESELPRRRPQAPAALRLPPGI